MQNQLRNPQEQSSVKKSRQEYARSKIMRVWVRSSTTSTDSAISSASNSSSEVVHESVGLYILKETIGQGNFGSVRVGVHVVTGSEVAIKIIKKDGMPCDLLQKVYREIELLKHIHHPYIIQVFQVMETARTIYLVTELAANGELFEEIKSRKRLREADARRYFWQVISAVDYCHKRGIVHRDIKAENLLIDDVGNLRLADFGFSNYFSPSDLLRTFCGSPPYAAPEVFLGEMYYGPHVDVWSMGVLLYVLIAGFPPFDGRDFREIRFKVLRTTVRFPYHVSIECGRLIGLMLNKNPLKRPTVAEIMVHPWMQIGNCEEQIKREITVHQSISLAVPKQKFVENMAYIGIDPSETEKSINTRKFDNLHGMYQLLVEGWKRVRLDEYRANLVDFTRLKMMAEISSKQPIPLEPSRIDIEPIKEAIGVALATREEPHLGEDPSAYPYLYVKSELSAELQCEEEVAGSAGDSTEFASDHPTREAAEGNGKEAELEDLEQSSKEAEDDREEEESYAEQSAVEKRRWRMSNDSVPLDAIPTGELERNPKELGEIASFQRLVFNTSDERMRKGLMQCRVIPKRPSLPEVMKTLPALTTVPTLNKLKNLGCLVHCRKCDMFSST